MRKQNKFRTQIKYLIHFLFWVLLVCFLNSDFLTLEWGYFSKENDNILIPLIYGMVSNIIIFYSQILFIIPRKFSYKKLSYWIQSSLLIIVLALIISLCDLYYINKLEIRDMEIFNIGRLWHLFFFNALIRFFWWAMALAYRFPIDWMRKERQNREVLKQKMEMELEFLKAQINPHFLFNGMNSIYHLIDQRPEIAKISLLQFSDLLRYQIYECQAEFLSLEKEIKYLKDYIGLQKIRKEGDIQVYLEIDDLLECLNSNEEEIKVIAPLLISPFIENAFKYVSNFEEIEKNIIKIQLGLRGEYLHVEIYNTIDPPDIYRQMQKGGLGIKNVQKRLDLIYLDRYELHIDKNEKYYKVNLEIKL